MAASPCGNHLAREGRLARASALLLMQSPYLFAPFGICKIVAWSGERDVSVQPATAFKYVEEIKMAQPATPDFTDASYDDLLQIFVNAVNLIVKEKQVDAAKKTIAAIQKEWERRRKAGDSFDFE